MPKGVSPVSELPDFAAAIVTHSSISHLTVKATFKVRKTKSSRDGVPLSGEPALWRPVYLN